MAGRGGHGRPFQKNNKAAVGHGRPKGSSHILVCREWAEKKGWAKLIDWADGKDYQVGLKDGRMITLGPPLELQFQATKTLLEYGYGKPTQAIHQTGVQGISILQLIRESEEERGLPSSFDD